MTEYHKLESILCALQEVEDDCCNSGYVKETLAQAMKEPWMSKDTVAQRAAAWLADYEDGGLLLETMEPNELDAYLLDQAYDIMCQLWEDARHED